jgi:hypothetical protein
MEEVGEEKEMGCEKILLSKECNKAYIYSSQ